MLRTEENTISECKFEDVLPFWSEQLWPGRQSAIEPFSCIDINGEIDIAIASLAQPVFFKYSFDEKIIGVVSAQYTAEKIIRLRGLWISTTHQHQGHGKKLAQAVLDYAVEQNAQTLWTMGRVTNLDFYEKCGFMLVKKIDSYEFGPHYVMSRSV